MGLAMGLTAMGIIYSPWGRRSGAHINPGVTLTFFRLGKMAPKDAAFYVAGQFAGGAIGVLVSAGILGKCLSDPAVNYVVTVPGVGGVGAAFMAELIISFGLMLTVLASSNSVRLHRFTGLFAGMLVRDIHLRGGTSIGNEHEPSAHGSVRSLGMVVDGALGLYDSTDPGHAGGSRGVRALARSP